MSIIETTRRASARFADRPYDPQVAKVLRNTYLLLAISMLPAIAGAAVGVVFNPVALMGPWLMLGFFVAFMFGGQYLIVKNSNSFAGVGYLQVFTFGMGYFFGPTFALALTFSNGLDLIFLAFGGTAAIFFGMAAAASAVKKNLGMTSMGTVLTVGIFMMFFLALANFVMGIPALGLAISAAFLVIASGFIMYTINGIIHGGERNYITATLTLFIMVLNVFVSILHLLMAFMGNRE